MPAHSNTGKDRPLNASFYRLPDLVAGQSDFLLLQEWGVRHNDNPACAGPPGAGIQPRCGRSLRSQPPRTGAAGTRCTHCPAKRRNSLPRPGGRGHTLYVPTSAGTKRTRMTPRAWTSSQENSEVYAVGHRNTGCGFRHGAPLQLDVVFSSSLITKHTMGSGSASDQNETSVYLP